MKKLIMAVVVLAACRTSPPVVVSTSTSPVTGNATGGPDALGAVWGNASGPARDAISREELEKRELIMMRCLRHDKYDIAGDAPNPGGSRAMVVNLTYKDLSRSTNFIVVQGPSKRWYVEKFDLDPLQGICLA